METPLTTPQDKFTLNGILYDNAVAMVSSFIKNMGNYQHTPTCVWFSKAAFQQMYAIIADPIYDGIRFYFARTIPDNKYTVVAVSTLNGGLDPADETGKRHIHQDYFQFVLPAQTGEEYYGQLGRTTPQEGALLYTPSSLPSVCSSGDDDCPPDNHYITCEQAYQMVNYIGPDEINTASEWFDKGIIKGLIDATPDGGGIRIYFARGLKIVPPSTTTRHGFIFITTSLDAGTTSQLSPNGIQTDNFVCIPLVLYYPDSSFLGGGDDNGEQCPTNCKGVILPKP